MNEANEIMAIKLKHGEEFSRSFRAVMDTSRCERDESLVNLERYKDTILDDLTEAKQEMSKALGETRMDLVKLRYSLNHQHGVNKMTEGNFDMFQ